MRSLPCPRPDRPPRVDLRPGKVAAPRTALLLTAAAPGWAINKCTGPDGRVSFQDAPCQPGQQGSAIEVRPASGPADTTPAATPASTEGAFGPRWQRRTWLENRGVPDAESAIDAHRASCAQEQARLRARQTSANNNLAGATWRQSIATEMQAAATLCDSRARELYAERDALQRELRELQANP